MLTIRPAATSDVPLLKTLIYEFAEFERLPVSIQEEDLLRDGFGESPKFRLLIAEWDGRAAGYAMYFDYYSSFEGRPSIFLEDIYIRPEFRTNGIGKAMLAKIAALAKEQNYAGMRWEVLDWNTPAIDFYRKLGATFMDDRKLVSLQGEAFERTANGAR